MVKQIRVRFGLLSSMIGTNDSGFVPPTMLRLGGPKKDVAREVALSRSVEAG
jgi:hypothetical protein